jgi:hypothetical protein
MQILATNFGGMKYVIRFFWNKLLGQMGEHNIIKLQPFTHKTNENGQFSSTNTTH